MHELYPFQIPGESVGPERQNVRVQDLVQISVTLERARAQNMLGRHLAKLTSGDRGVAMVADIDGAAQLNDTVCTDGDIVVREGILKANNDEAEVASPVRLSFCSRLVNLLFPPHIEDPNSLDSILTAAPSEGRSLSGGSSPLTAATVRYAFTPRYPVGDG